MITAEAEAKPLSTFKPSHVMTVPTASPRTSDFRSYMIPDAGRAWSRALVEPELSCVVRRFLAKTWAEQTVPAEPQEQEAVAEIVGGEVSAQARPTSVKRSTTRSGPAAAQATAILRSHFANGVVENLRKLQKHAGTARAAMYAASVFQMVRQMRDLAPLDPYLEAVMALHDALAFENSWMKYSVPQYEAAAKVLERLAAEKAVTAEKVEKAIVRLEQIGFDTTPFGFGNQPAE
jgi:hypothetical protein